MNNKFERAKKILAIVKKEFLIIWKDPKSRWIIISLPIIQLILFANAITMEVRNINVAVIDQDNSVESRELISKFENSKQFEKIAPLRKYEISRRVKRV